MIAVMQNIGGLILVFGALVFGLFGFLAIKSRRTEAFKMGGAFLFVTVLFVMGLTGGVLFMVNSGTKEVGVPTSPIQLQNPLGGNATPGP